MEDLSIPGMMIPGNMIGRELNDQIEQICGLYQAAGLRKSKITVAIMMMEKGAKEIRDEAFQRAKDKIE